MSQYRDEVDFARLFAEGFQVKATETITGSVFVAPFTPGKNVIVVMIPTGETSTEAVKAMILRYRDTIRTLAPLLGLGGGV